MNLLLQTALLAVVILTIKKAVKSHPPYIHTRIVCHCVVLKVLHRRCLGLCGAFSVLLRRLACTVSFTLMS